MRVALIGNYTPDGQESMLRYGALLHDGLAAAGHEVALAAPAAALNVARRRSSGVWKWIGYVDKYALGVREIARAVRRADVVHVCDHSNAVYVPLRKRKPYIVTCHDLLAVRGALGENTDCPASFTGKFLQRAILAGLRRASAIACVSGATLRDATRLLDGFRGELAMTPISLNHAYRQLDAATVRKRLDGVPALRGSVPYVLHVGSNALRKNRDCTVRALARAAPEWSGKLVMAGAPPSPELEALAAKLGVADRIVAVAKPTNDLLEALYNGALALLFPSRFEGFGWPIVEAQACGCPVICSDRDPHPEVAGRAALFCDADDDAAFGRAIRAVAADSAARERLVRAGLDNAARYERAAMIARYVALYERALLAQDLTRARPTEPIRHRGPP